MTPGRIKWPVIPPVIINARQLGRSFVFDVSDFRAAGRPGQIEKSGMYVCGTWNRDGQLT